MKLLLPCLLSTGFLLSCATDSGNDASDARGRATNQALYEAGRVLGNAAVSALFNVAQSEISGNKADYASAASEGLWKSAGSIFSSGTVERIVNAYGAKKLPKTANTAAEVAAAAGVSPEITNEIAAVISTAAGAPPSN